jgi:hypothetical protein
VKATLEGGDAFLSVRYRAKRMALARRAAAPIV